eukprot:3720713-Rhodomonas_salina.3
MHYVSTRRGVECVGDRPRGWPFVPGKVRVLLLYHMRLVAAYAMSVAGIAVPQYRTGHRTEITRTGHA